MLLSIFPCQSHSNNSIDMTFINGVERYMFLINTFNVTDGIMNLKSLGVLRRTFIIYGAQFTIHLTINCVLQLSMLKIKATFSAIKSI